MRASRNWNAGWMAWTRRSLRWLPWLCGAGALCSGAASAAWMQAPELADAPSGMAAAQAALPVSPVAAQLVALDDGVTLRVTAPMAPRAAPRAVQWADGQGGCDGCAVLAVADASLDRSRGGFDAGGGLLVSLGIERLVSVNGQVRSSTAFTIADVGRLSGEQAKQAGAALAALNVLQNGPGNVYLVPSTPPLQGGTVLQNSLNDQVVRTQTVINTSVNSLNTLKALNFQDGVLTALRNVAGSR